MPKNLKYIATTAYMLTGVMTCNVCAADTPLPHKFDYSGVDAFYGADSEFNMSDKPVNSGTLDYLRELGLWEKGSIYSIGMLIAEGDEVDTSAIKPNELLRYEINESYIYCDRITGKIITDSDGNPITEPRKGKDDIAVMVRDLYPMLFSFSFKQTEFGDPDTSKGTHTKEGIDYVIGESDEFKHYVPENGLDRRTNPSGDIYGAFCSPAGFDDGGNPNEDSNNGQGVYNNGNSNLNSIHADFFDCAASPSSGGGAAISNRNGTVIKDGIFGDFMNNYVAKGSGSEGGAIWNYGDVEISVIAGNFIANYVGGEGGNGIRGGAIYNYSKSTIGTITGAFIGNMAFGGDTGIGDGCYAGGAIANGSGLENNERGSVIKLIVADFIGNAVLNWGSKGGDGHGGAIYNGGKDSTIEHIIGDFYGNCVDVYELRENIEYTENAKAHGGAICNIGITQNNDTGRAYINLIQGAFVRNYARGTSYASAGAIYNNRGGYIGTIEANFVRNHAETTSTGPEAKSDKRVSASGGAIVNAGPSQSTEKEASRIENIIGNFYGNWALAATNRVCGGAIVNEEFAEIGTIDGNFIENYVQTCYSDKVYGIAEGGAIHTDKNSIIEKISGSFYDNHAENSDGVARGGAISNGGALDSIVNAVFFGNYVKGKGQAYGGAIYNEATLNIVANDDVSYFNNNYVILLDDDDNVLSENDEAIYAASDSKISLVARNNGAIIFEDSINGDDYDLFLKSTYTPASLEKGGELKEDEEDTRLKPQGEDRSYVIFNNAVKNARITMDDVNLNLYAGQECKTGEARKTYLGSPRDAYSDVLETSKLAVRSGYVMMADGQTTEYLFKEIKAYGPTYTYYEHGGAGEKKDGEEYTPNDYALFSIDVDLNVGKDVADIITAFASKKNAQASDWGELLSEGRVHLDYINVYGPTNWGDRNLKDFSEIKVQVINFVALDESKGGEVITDEDFYKQFEKECAIELDELGIKGTAWSKMRSSQLVFNKIELGTTKTHNDSIVFHGILDNLAEWAELDDKSAPYSWVKTDVKPADKSQSYESYADVPVEDQEKVFTILASTHHLTRDINTENEAIWGNKWTIRGISAETLNPGDAPKSVLDLHGWKLLTKVSADQEGHLRGMTLKNVKDNAISNLGSLTLDTMIVDKTLEVKNSGKLVITGIMDINNTITSDTAAEKYTMVIDASSQVAREWKEEEPPTDNEEEADVPMPLSEEPEHGYAYVNITGTVERQNIIHKGTGSYNRIEAKTNYDYSTVTNLIITEANGDASAAFTNFKDNSLKMEGGLLNLYNLDDKQLGLRRLDVNGGSIHLINPVHVNLEKATMGRIYAAEYGKYDPTGNGHIFVDALKLTKTSLEDEVYVKFADSAIAASVVPFADEAIGAGLMEGESSTHYMWDPIILWHVTYDYDSGHYIFRKYPVAYVPDTSGGEGDGDGEEEDDDNEKTPDEKAPDEETPDEKTPDEKTPDEKIPDEKTPDEKTPDEKTPDEETPDEETPDEETPDEETPNNNGTSGGSLSFNPSIMAGPVAEQMGGYASMQEVYNHSFEHAELFSATLNRARKERLYSREYAVVSTAKSGKNAVSHAGGSSRSAESLAGFKGGMWVRPYATSERIPVYDGIKAHVNLYGGLVGGDSSLSEYRNGWASVFSGFVGYTGSTQKFSRRDSAVRTEQNGGVVGITETLYYRNFYTAITATIGTSSAHANTMYGSENFHMVMAGVASRSGYSIELAKGRYVIQPTWQMSFTTIDMPDYTNSSGVRVVSDTMYAFQIHPYIKAVMNTESGWNPYITAGYVHDFGSETSYYAQGYKLPGVRMEPYAEYGIGVQKTWYDRYTIYGQATGRNGGRDGVEVSAGMRWAW